MSVLRGFARGQNLCRLSTIIKIVHRGISLEDIGRESAEATAPRVSVHSTFNIVFLGSKKRESKQLLQAAWIERSMLQTLYSERTVERITTEPCFLRPKNVEAEETN